MEIERGATLDQLIGQEIRLPGHFVEPVRLEGVRQMNGAVELRVRTASGTLDETILTEDQQGEPEGVEAGEAPAGRPPSDGGRRVQLTVRATKDDLHTLNVALAGLRDLLGAAGQMTIDLRVDADSGAKSIAPTRLQNMVLQHLEEDQDVTFDYELE